MDPFIGSEPDLINNRMIVAIETPLTGSYDNKSNLLTGMGIFYNKYIEPNMFPLIILTISLLYLSIKYVIKRDNDEKHIDDHETAENFQKKHPSHIHKGTDNLMDDLVHQISDDYLLTESE